MEIGSLRHRVTLQKITVVRNPDGSFVEDWVDISTVWAAVSNLSGREFYAAAAVQAENTVEFTIRYFPEVDTSERILFRQKAYNITAIDNIEYKNKYMVIKTQILNG